MSKQLPSLPDSYVTSGGRDLFSAEQMTEYGAACALASRPAEGDGWKLVPVEPTEEMLRRVLDTGLYHCGEDAARAVLIDEYREMLNAAPPPPTAGSGHGPYINAIHDEGGGVERMELSELGRMILTTDIDVLPSPTAGSGEKG